MKTFGLGFRKYLYYWQAPVTNMDKTVIKAKTYSLYILDKIILKLEIRE